jgi:hypothetical protein
LDFPAGKQIAFNQRNSHISFPELHNRNARFNSLTQQRAGKMA